MCNSLFFISYNLMVIIMNKKISSSLLVVLILMIIVVNIFIQDKNLVNKITIFISSFISLLVAYIVGIKIGKKGLFIGLIVGISISSISLLIHFIIAKEYFDTLYLRLLTFMVSGICGGIIGVNKKTD